MTARAWRLLITEPADGATNMAIDEAIWRSRQTGVSPPTLRFFAWAPPTVSLGYGPPPHPPLRPPAPPTPRAGAADRRARLRPAARSSRRPRRLPKPRRRPGAPADRRQRHLPRRARARADLQRGRHRRRSGDRLR